jgi:hypothetical protein
VEPNITRLMVSINKLFERLTDWSKGMATYSQISDRYIQLGKDFNAAIAAFEALGIDIR